jgi:hypothetical protein
LSVTITRHVLKTLQQPAKEAFGGFAIPPLLHKDVEHHTILINRAPEIMLHALDANEHLIHVPLIPGPWPAATEAVGEALAKFLAPTPYGFIGDMTMPRSDKSSSTSRRLRLNT